MTEKLAGLERRILANTFVDGVRIRSQVDEAAFEELCTSLRELATALARYSRSLSTLSRNEYGVLESSHPAPLSAPTSRASPSCACSSRTAGSWVLRQGAARAIRIDGSTV
jgi:hypothetical protein